MKCSNCGKEIKEDLKFCKYCGKEVTKDEKIFCQKCGNVIKQGEMFCTKCGMSIKDANISGNKKKKKSGKGFIIFLVIVTLVLAGCIGGYYFLTIRNQKQDKNNEDIVVESRKDNEANDLENVEKEDVENNKEEIETEKVQLKDNYSVDEIYELLENGEDAYVFFYNNCQNYYWCEWCKVATEAVHQIEREENISVYYVKTRDDNGNYTYSDSIKDKIYPYLGDKYMENHTLWIPLFIHINNGKVVEGYRSTCDNQDMSACPVSLTTSEYNHLLEKYRSIVNS